jgi:5-bromo-4-chloroindolyl phosphate hydrolysis protein
MASTFWIAIAAIAICAIVTDGVVKIIRAAKSGRAGSQKFTDMETDLDSLEAELNDARQRIEVLEKIVTDEKYDLGKKIDDLST